jgi:O-antigen ligase
MFDSLFGENLRSDNFPFSLVFYCGLGVLLGIVCLSFTPLWTFAALVGTGLVFCAHKRPEFLPLVYISLTSTIIIYGQAPTISIGFGTFYLTDVVLMLSLTFITVRLIKKPGSEIVRTPLDWPLLIFWGASLVSTLVAIISYSLPWKRSLHEVRVVSGYLIFFAVTNLVRDKRQVTLLFRGFLLLAIIAAMVTIVQYLLGQSLLIISGRIEDIDTEGQVLSGVTRVIPPGQSIIMVAFTAIFATMVFERASAVRFLQSGLLALALIVTFFRASWVVAGMTMLIIGLLSKGRQTKRLIVSGLVTTMVVAIILMAVLSQPGSSGANLSHAAFERLTSLFDSKTFENPNSSLRWRDFEYRYALPHILSNPFVGLGLGARYRPWTERDHEKFDGRTFIHNGHLYVLLKSGIFGYLGLLWFMLCILVRGLKYWRLIPDPYMRSIVLAFALTSPAVLIVSIVEPYMMTVGWTPVIGIIAGINEIILRGFPPVSSEVR